MIRSSTIKHLRFPFSFFLMPVYLFALSISSEIQWGNAIISFFLIHFFLYPASNGYNSYFDRDTQSIGGIKYPPPVTRQLYFTALLLDLLAVVAGFWIHWQFALMLFIYGLVSKAYSHPSIRLKRLPVTGWLIIGLFQGYFTFLMVYTTINNIYFPEIYNNGSVHFAALLSSALLWGAYPMTQIYQHEEDNRRKDISLSLKLGLLGTFHFSAIFFSLAMAGFFIFYLENFSWVFGVIFLLSMTPVLIFFLTWYFSARKNLSQINYENTMRLNLISSLCLVLVFTLFTLLH